MSMKLVNKNNKGIEKEVDDALGLMMIDTGEWEVAKTKDTSKGASENVSK